MSKSPHLVLELLHLLLQLLETSLDGPKPKNLCDEGVAQHTMQHTGDGDSSQGIESL